MKTKNLPTVGGGPDTSLRSVASLLALPHPPC